MTFRAANGVEIYYEVTGQVTYVFDQVLIKAAKFKLITSAPSGDVSVTFSDGTTGIIDAERLDAMNAQVITVFDTGTDILITDFGLFR